SLSVDRVSVAREGDAHHRAQGAGDRRPAGARDREVYGDAAAGASRESAGGRRDARLGPGARHAPRRPSRRGRRRRDDRLHPEGCGRHEAVPRGGCQGGARSHPAGADLSMVARELSTAVARFAMLLRRHGLPVTLIHATDGVRALDHLDIGDRAELRLAFRTVFVGRPEEVPVFDRCFDAFWRAASAEEETPGLIQVPPGEAREGDALLKSSSQKREGVALETWGEGDEAGDTGDTGEPLRVPSASESEALVGQDFSTFGADQLDEILRLTIKIARRLAHRITRRRRPVRRRGRVDLRRTLRANLTRGDLIELRYRERKRKKVRLVLLCDVSGSMDLYSRFLLQFLFALQNVFGRVETFIFSTRLTRVTELLRGRSYRQVLRRLTDVRDWSGGTRIGESFAQFNREWPHLVDRRTIVIVLSDGWDTGEPDVLATELMRIKRRAARLIWLNPLLGNPSYEPLTRGMAAAMPLIDDFAAGHNLAALRDLAGKLHL